MANYFARKAGNINAADVWATTPSGAAADVWSTFTSADVLHSNNFAITVNVSTTVGTVRNDNANSATAGGGFTLSNDVTLTANAVAGSTGTACVIFSGTAGNSATLIGNVTAGSGSGANGCSNSSTGTLSITGNVTGGSGGNANGVRNVSTGTIIITGNATGASFSNGHGVTNSSSGTIILTGNATGGSAGSGALNTSTGTLTISGNVTGGSSSTAYGASNDSTGTLTVTGIATGGTGAPGVNTSNAAGTVNLGRAKGNDFGIGSTGIAAGFGVVALQSHIVKVKEIEYGLRGMSPTSGPVFIEPDLGNLAIFQEYPTGSKTLSDPNDTAGLSPAVTDVRSGVVYNNGNDTGTCAVPAAASVAFGVPVDNTTGTAILTQADVQYALTAQGLTTARAGNLDNLDATVSSRLAPSGTLATVTTLTNAPASVTASDIWSHATRTITGGTVDTLTNAPTVPSAASIASQVRTELGPELTKVSALNTDRLANCATTQIVGTLLAQSQS